MIPISRAITSPISRAVTELQIAASAVDLPNILVDPESFYRSSAWVLNNFEAPEGLLLQEPPLEGGSPAAQFSVSQTVPSAATSWGIELVVKNSYRSHIGLFLTDDGGNFELYTNYRIKPLVSTIGYIEANTCEIDSHSIVDVGDYSKITVTLTNTGATGETLLFAINGSNNYLANYGAYYSNELSIYDIQSVRLWEIA